MKNSGLAFEFGWPHEHWLPLGSVAPGAALQSPCKTPERMKMKASFKRQVKGENGESKIQVGETQDRGQPQIWEEPS